MLTVSLQAYRTPERLDGDNQWQCSDEPDAAKVDALKGYTGVSLNWLFTPELQ